LRKVLARLFYAIARLRWRVTRPITLGVRLILEKDHAVLLVKHTYQAQWYLPGGGVKRGETLEEATRREAAEEIGATLGRLRLFGVYTNFYEHKSDHVVIFACDDFTLTGRTDAEIERFDFFGLDDLPAGLSPGTRRRIQEYVDGGDGPVVGAW
jgi:8-oxo-dGTP pyrophosphatase MutT (NUDIX family)